METVAPMFSFRSSKICLQFIVWLCCLSFPQFAPAAEGPQTLTVGESGATLYSRQDLESETIGRLEGGEELTPLAQAVGAVSWYLVRTKQGAVGWVKATDVAAGARVEESFQDKTSGRLSTWTAVSAAGRAYGGTWTAEADPETGTVSGAWTLRDEKGSTLLRGTWAANKFTTGWHGAWRAFVVGYEREYQGSWSAAAGLSGDAPLGDLFKAAAKDAVRGIWTAGGSSGSWSIRAAE